MEKGKATVKHWILFGVALLAITVTAWPYILSGLADRGGATAGGAGGPGGGRLSPAQRLEMMAKTLSLTEPQKAQVKTIQDEMMPKMQAIRQNTSLSPEQRRAQMQPLRTEMQTKIKQILTPEQQPKYEAMLAQMRARFGGGNGGPPNGARPKA
ncbi:MAG: hypothetical protein JO316_11845 [Abitibacteriaceae bacterium]|nr:hypothetical protein [Abditibacteriaceae bacterium]